MPADIGVWPAVERTLDDAGQIIGDKPVAHAVALLDDGIEIAGARLKRERGGIAHSRGEGALARAVRLEPLDAGLHFRLDAEVPG